MANKPSARKPVTSMTPSQTSNVIGPVRVGTGDRGFRVVDRSTSRTGGARGPKPTQEAG